MLIPIIILFFYILRFKRESIKIVSSMLIILSVFTFIFYPLSGIIEFPGILDYSTQIILRIFFFLFGFLSMVIVPIYIFKLVTKEEVFSFFKTYGVRRENIGKSILLFLGFSLIILASDAIILSGGRPIVNSADYPISGIVEFFRTFNEEFLFRGVLFIVLSSCCDKRIAAIASVSTFALAHPQYYVDFIEILVGPIAVGCITVAICWLSKNIIGAWLFHGLWNFNSLVIIPILIGFY